MSIEELIRRDVQTIRPEASCTEAARRMRDGNVGCLVVADHEEVPVGIVTDRDLALRVLADRGDPDQPVRDVMTRDPIFLSESASLREVIATMRELGFRRMIVVDDAKCLCGILTLDDLVMHLADTFANLARAIRNELGR
jgi:CBS domain-containing protein